MPDVGSALHDHRTAEAVVDADQADVDILADAFGAAEPVGGQCERVVVVVKEDVVLFNADCPVQHEADLQASADVPPQLGSLADANNAPPGTVRSSYLLLTTVPPPFT